MRTAHLAAYLVLAATLTGCIGGGDSTPISGTVLGPDGQPMPQVNISFQPTEKGKGTYASGTTDSAGKFTLKTREGDSVGYGTYDVMLEDGRSGEEISKAGPDAQNRIPQQFMRTGGKQVTIDGDTDSENLVIDLRKK